MAVTGRCTGPRVCRDVVDCGVQKRTLLRRSDLGREMSMEVWAGCGIQFQRSCQGNRGQREVDLIETSGLSMDPFHRDTPIFYICFVPIIYASKADPT